MIVCWQNDLFTLNHNLAFSTVDYLLFSLEENKIFVDFKFTNDSKLYRENISSLISVTTQEAVTMYFRSEKKPIVSNEILFHSDEQICLYKVDNHWKYCLFKELERIGTV